MSISSMLGFGSPRKKSKLKKLPKIPKGLVARAKRKAAKKKRDAEIAKRKQFIAQLRKAAQ